MRIVTVFATSCVLWNVCLSVAEIIASAAEQLALDGVALKATDPESGAALHARLRAAWRFESVPGLFMDTTAAEEAIATTGGDQTVVNFSALMPWPEIHSRHAAQYPGAKLFLFLRHGKAWENLPNATNDPGRNQKCGWQSGNQTIVNWDSGLVEPTGVDQARQVAEQLARPAVGGSFNISWATALRLDSAAAFGSPNQRALHTASLALNGSISRRIVVSELVRSTIGHDVSNARHAAISPTLAAAAPWDTGCEEAAAAANITMLSQYAESGRFTFNVRPAGVASPGLVSNADTLWRSDFRENDLDREARATAFLAQIFEDVNEPVVQVTTHGEMIQAFLSVGGDPHGQTAKIGNVQIVPMLLRRVANLTASPGSPLLDGAAVMV